MYKLILVLLVFSVLLSCSEDKENVDSFEENFYGLTVGNSWTYNYFVREGNSDNFNNLNVVETAEITGTSEMNNEIYFNLQVTTTGNEQNHAPCSENGVEVLKVRDSLGYLITSDHVILFSRITNEPFIISQQIWGSIFGELESESQNITVEAGTFNSLSNRIYVIDPNNGEELPGIEREFFSDGLGQVQRNFSTVSNPQHRWEKRLQFYTIL